MATACRYCAVPAQDYCILCKRVVRFKMDDLKVWRCTTKGHEYVYVRPDVRYIALKIGC